MYQISGARMKSSPQALRKLRKHLRDTWKPPKDLNAWKWGEENVFIPAQASPRPGKYSTDLVPYVRTPMECWSDKKTKYIVLNWSAQSTKTTCEIVCMFYSMANYMGNIIFNMPSENMAKSKSETTIRPMIEMSPELKKLKPADKNRYKILEMFMKNGAVNFIGGNSATNLASRSAGRIFTDEIDKLKKELVDEADPLSLLFERTEAYSNPKIFLTSTPTVPTGHINQWFLKGTQEYFHYPCPHCKETFTAKWKMIKWKAEDGMSIDEQSKTAYLECPHCKGKIENKHKRKMLAKGEWKPENEEASGEIRSFHFNRIMSPLSTFSDMVYKWLHAIERAKTGDKGELKNFINSALSEVWQDELGKAVTDDEIEQLIDKNRPRGVVPKESLGIVAGVDTQDNGFYYSVRAFGKHNTSWLITEGFVETLGEIERLLVNGRFGGMAIPKIYIDLQGHRTDEVYRFCRKHLHRVIPCAGRGQRTLNSEYTFTNVDKIPGHTNINGLQRLVWNTTIIKDLMYAKMKLMEREPGAFRVHKDIGKEYRDSLKSEYKNEKGDYEHIKKYANHYLDCEALCFLGARIQGIEYWGSQTVSKPRQRVERGPTVNNRKPW